MPDEFQYVKLPDGSYGKFRADAKDSDIQAAITKDFPDAFKPKQSYLQQALTGGSKSMIPGVSSPGASPATDPETANAMQQGAMVGGLAAMPIAAGLRAGAAGVARTVVGSGLGSEFGEHIGRSLGKLVKAPEEGADIGRVVGAIGGGAAFARGVNIPEGNRYSFLNKYIGTPPTAADIEYQKTKTMTEAQEKALALNAKYEAKAGKAVPLKESPYANQQKAVTKKAAKLSQLADEQRIVSPDSPPPYVEGSYWSFEEPALREAAIKDRAAALIYKKRFGSLPENYRYLTDVDTFTNRGEYKSRNK